MQPLKLRQTAQSETKAKSLIFKVVQSELSSDKELALDCQSAGREFESPGCTISGKMRHILDTGPILGEKTPSLRFTPPLSKTF
jgi:hypothetical protein